MYVFTSLYYSFLVLHLCFRTIVYLPIQTRLPYHNKKVPFLHSCQSEKGKFKQTSSFIFLTHSNLARSVNQVEYLTRPRG